MRQMIQAGFYSLVISIILSFERLKIRFETRNMVKEMNDTLDKLTSHLDKIESAVLKYTDAQNLHDMSRRHPISEDRNKLAGDVYEARKNLEGLSNEMRGLIEEARSNILAEECDHDSGLVTSEVLTPSPT